MNQLKVFDASFMTYRMYHTAKKVNPDEVLDTAMYFFFNSVFSIMKKDSGTPMIFLYDARNSTKFRKGVNEDYKANRTTNPDVVELKRRIMNYLEKLGLFTLEIEGYEADDIAYYMSRNMNNPINFLTEDKDWYSYVIDNKFLYRPISKESVTFNDLLMKHSKIIDSILDGRDINDYHLTLPELVHKIIVEKKAILGDGSDNVKGFKGIGPKTASQIVVKLNKLDSYDDFVGKSKSGKLFQSNLERFKNNLQVLGYDHIDDVDFTSYFTYQPSSDIDYESVIMELANKINSNTLVKRIESITNALSKNNVDVTFSWR